VWHASFAPAPGLQLADETCFEIAAGALKGVGDATLGEWQERGEKAWHVRRRLSTKEQATIGDMCDLRGEDEGRERLEKALRWLPKFAWEYARQEAAGLL